MRKIHWIMKTGCTMSPSICCPTIDEEIQRALGQGQLIHDCPLANTDTKCFLTKTGKKARKSTVIILIQHRTRSTSQCNNKRKGIKKEEIYCPYLQRHNYLCRKS